MDTDNDLRPDSPPAPTRLSPTLSTYSIYRYLTLPKIYEPSINYARYPPPTPTT